MTLTSIFHWSLGQDTLLISKDEFISQAVANSHRGRVATKEAEMAVADFQQSNSLYLPSVSASYTAMTTNNPLMAFGSKLNQEILTQEDFDPNKLNNPDNVNNFATEILVLQPLLNLDGVYGRRAAGIQREAYQLKAERTKEYLELQATELFMKLQLAYEAVEVLTGAQTTAQEAVQLVSDYYEQGLVQKADLLDAQVRATEVDNQLRFARTNIQNTSDQLSLLMGQSPGTVTLRPTVQAARSYDAIPQFLSDVPRSRKDLVAMSKATEGYESMWKSQKMKHLPRINAFGSFQLYDNQMVGFGASGYILGARLSWNLFDGYANVSKTTKARLAMEKAQIEQQEYHAEQQAELQKAIRMLTDARSKVEASQLALDQATEAHKIRKDRFEQGLEKTVDLLTAESQMQQKELQYLQAIFEYGFTKEYLHFLTRE